MSYSIIKLKNKFTINTSNSKKEKWHFGIMTVKPVTAR